MATIYILCGLPFSGKSTFASALIKNKQCQLVSIDTIIQSTYPNNKTLSEKQWEEVYKKSYSEASALLKIGQTLVYDGANQTFEMRDTLRNIASQYGADAKVVYIKIPIIEAENRLILNEGTHNHKDLAITQEEYAIQHWQEPSEEEKVLIYTEGQPAFVWIENNL